MTIYANYLYVTGLYDMVQQIRNEDKNLFGSVRQQNVYGVSSLHASLSQKRKSSLKNRTFLLSWLQKPCYSNAKLTDSSTVYSICMRACQYMYVCVGILKFNEKVESTLHNFFVSIQTKTVDFSEFCYQVDATQSFWRRKDMPNLQFAAFFVFCLFVFFYKIKCRTIDVFFLQSPLP